MSAIPAYLSITDFGFGSVAGNDMTIRVAQGDREAALGTFQSTFWLVNAVSFVAGALAILLTFSLPLPEWLRVDSISHHEMRLTMIALSIYSLASLHSSILISAFRSEGEYSLGVSRLNLVRLLENAAMFTSLFFHAGPLSVAMVGAAFRLAGTVFTYGFLLRKIKWISLGTSHASWKHAKDLTRPALAFMAFPAGNALSIQGMTALIGILLGPLAVAVFGPMRTLSRFAFQLVDSVKNSVWPELSAAYGTKNWELARRLHRTCCQVSLWLAVISVTGLSVFGPLIFRLWVRGRVVMDIPCFYVLLLVVVASSLWNTSSAVPIAANRHERLALQYLAGTFFSLVSAFIIVPHLGITGAAISLLACDVWMGCLVIRGSNALLSDNNREFLYSLFNLSKARVLLVH
jgi:O-antigen/teichoic acid export membrane protein